MLHEFIAINRDEIIRRCRAKVATRSVPPPTRRDRSREYHVFLDQLADDIAHRPDVKPRDWQERRPARARPAASGVHRVTGRARLWRRLSGYHRAGGGNERSISTEDFRTLNRCIDDAIAGAVTEYGRERNQSIVDGETTRGSERLGFLAHELRET